MEQPQQQSDINLESLQAVKDLKSRFEQLALDASSNRVGNGINQDDFLLAPATSPRPRASSNTYLNLNNAESIHQLRPSSSSSDLTVPLKRPPPPPPPPRGSKITRSPSPSVSPPSPLTRPVPIPQSLLASSLLLNPQQSDTGPTPRNVSALKGRFDSPPSSLRLHTPRQSVSESYPEPPSFIAPKPAIPPRPSALLAPSRTVSQDSTTEKARRSPFSDDEDHDTGSDASLSSTTVPPTFPPRKVRHERPPSHPNRSVRDLSDSSAENDVRPSTRPSSMMIPPPPPRRPVSSISPFSDLISLSPAPQPMPASSVASPPPLPVRRSTLVTQPQPPPAEINQQPRPPPPPRLPSRTQQPAVIIGNNNNSVVYDSPAPSPVAERRPVGTSKLKPPPTRTIGLGERLPAVRPPTSPSSDDDSGDEEDPKAHPMDSLPDSSSSSRRPPTLSFRDGSLTEPRIHVHAHTGCVQASGTHIVVAQGHHMRIYDLSLSDIPQHCLDTKDIAKDAKITCMELRPCDSNLDSGFLLWVGTKEGHIFELDIRTGVVLGIKHAAHIYPITHMFRYGRSMVTLDESGKALVFSPDTFEISLANTQPRVVRTTEKQDFVRLFGGKLWTAARLEHHGIASTQNSKMPIIRVYDLFNPASAGRSLLPSEHVGAVTSATILPSHPDMVYVGHEEGFVTIWALETDDGWPKCVEAVKVSTSGVLSLEGVNDRLWAGSRNGMISAYDVMYKPWVMTNCWNAHPGLPVMKIMVNYHAIERTGRLCVVSIGRDEQLRLWDGLLGLDWVDKELSKSETSFSSFREITALVVSWNCDSARPDSLNDDPINREFFHEVLNNVHPPPDLIAFGFQEVIDLESRRMVAKNVLLGGKKKPDDALSDKVTGAYKRWYDRLVIAVRSAMPRDVEYSVTHTESLIGLFSCVFVKNTERPQFTDVSVTTIKRGMGGRYGNKGGIVARCVIGDSSLCLINCHLAAGQKAVRRRNADVAGMLEDRAVFSPSDHQLAYVGGGDGSMVLDHEFVLFNGDMNYRIDHRRDAIIAAIRTGDLSSLLQHDQLLREIKFNRGCRLRGFSEGPLLFAPTYKYDPRSNEYDTSEKRRAPAWCDRILSRSHVASRIRQLHYRRYEANVSDHRPISAAFSLTVKTLQPESREKQKAVVEAAWIKEQMRLLVAAKEFYVRQALM